MNVVIRFTFKLDGPGWLGGFFDGKEHVAALSLGAEAFRIRRMSGIGPTSPSAELDAGKLKLNDGAWHTVVWEIHGEEMVATVDDSAMVRRPLDGTPAPRAQHGRRGLRALQGRQGLEGRTRRDLAA